jgi:hypothetical protein
MNPRLLSLAGLCAALTLAAPAFAADAPAAAAPATAPDIIATAGNATSDIAAAQAIEADNPKHLPAFPGAEGYGALATGGRVGTVYHVTNLNDAGPGSFRDAVSQGHRTVVFDVGGYVDLQSDVHVASNITIAGQTAPGEGIALRNREASFSGDSNVIVRYLRFRPGGTPGEEHKYAIAPEDASDVIFDHCSIEWASWDAIGMSRSHYITLQNCLIGEDIKLQQFGCLCESDDITFSHNLWIDNESRNPKAKGVVEYVNNVVYNWGVTGLAGAHSGTDHWVDVINNYFIKGPTAKSDHFAGEYWPSDHVYQNGNYAALACDGSLDGRLVVPDDFHGEADHGPPTFADTRFTHPIIPATIDTAAAAVDKVLAGAGASLHRDAIDTRLVAQVRSFGKDGKLIDGPADVGGFGDIAGGAAPVDTDKDGIPDAWETAHGLNPTDPTDAAKLTPSGYSNLEVYLNSLVAAPSATK